MTGVDDLPPRARRILASTLRPRSPGDQLQGSWYDQRASNFDSFDYERVKDAAEADGFIEYVGGHARVTERGIQWAQAGTK